MKKLIRLLVENLFDDIYDLNNDVNDMIDLGDELNTYNKYHPKNFDELRNLVEQLLEKRGKDADLNDIDVSKVTSFGEKINNKSSCHGYFGLFFGLDPHNIKIDNWDVSNVINMNHMFWGCENFNCNLSDWNVSKVENMFGMFYYCKNFTGQGLKKWNVSNVENMSCTFYECKNFNCDLSNWNISNVETMNNIFYGCTSLKNKPSWY